MNQVTCPCGVDHWMHVAGGFQGIVGMMATLTAGNVPISAAAMAKLDQELERLRLQIEQIRSTLPEH